MLLCLFLGDRGAVQVYTSFLLAERDAFLCHDLQELQRGGVRKIALRRQDVVDLPYCAGAACPQHAQDVELGVGGPGRGLSRHGARVSTIFFVVSTNFFVGSLDWHRRRLGSEAWSPAQPFGTCIAPKLVSPQI